MTKDFDFKADKPTWPLSSYGPAKHEKNLLPPLDESPEELRLKAVAAMRSGNINEYLQYEQNAFTNAEQVFANARNDIKGAFEAAKRNSLGPDPPNNASVFRGSAERGSAFGAANSSAFGQPSVFGAQSTGPASAFGQQQGSSAYGKPAFVAPAFGQGSSTFGQPSVVNPTFDGAAANGGAFSAFAGPGPSAFATAATNPTTSPVFGQSAFGTVNPTSTNSAFGVPSAFGQTSSSGFGQASPFGAPNAAPSAFGQPPSAPDSAFGQPSTAPFGQPSQNTSTFGQSFGQATPAASAFSQTTPTSAFGTLGSAQLSAFGQSVSPVSLTGSTGGPRPHARSVAPDFANAKSTYKPGRDPYDSLLPANYSSLLPENVRTAFAAPRFSWDNVPDWIPPMDMR
ncbi:hypothetical protein F5148DRAFT_1278954 [Russula earlei]|uniref:Uncharacterized protein n=1 Tax=Russula earlei TaxID=71964 RepID=A0ACC0UNU3_9AGAM|nr:hypothetical protein F5148DRAFT_1278954 [Russula earlei]